MHFKLIIIMSEDKRTQDVLAAARDAGATGCTVLNQARGEGLSPVKTFLGLSINNHVDVILMLAEEHLSRDIMEQVATAGEFEKKAGSGIAFQIDVEDVIGIKNQIDALTETVEDRL